MSPPTRASYERAIELYRDNGNSYQEAVTLIRIGDTHHATGSVDAARRTWQDALTILDGLDHGEAEADEALNEARRSRRPHRGVAQPTARRDALALVTRIGHPHFYCVPDAG